MAESVRELVVVLSMEAGTFSKTCKDINQQIKGVEAEFNNITAGAGSWTDTMAGRKAKMDALTETLDLQKTKVATIAAELEKANKALEADPGNLGAAKKVSSLETQLNNAEGAAKKTKEQIEQLNQISLQKLGSTLETFGGNLQRFGRKFSLYIGGPLSALGIKSFNLAKDYETAMADIQIATKQTDDEMVIMYDTVKDMSEVRPAGFIETAGVMGSLARAGLAGDVLERVTGYMLDLAATSDIDAEGAASGVIKFLNATEGGVDNIDRFSSALLWLGNEGVSTTGEIFDMSQRMAATGSLAGFSTTQILALASGFASMGIESQAGGSAMSKLMKKMQLANEVGGGAMKEFAENTNTAGLSVRDIQLAADDSDWVKGMAESMNKTKAEVKDMVAAMVALDGIASASGLSAEAFMAGWSKDPGNAALAFFEGLHQAALSGDESVLQLLDTLGITEVRMSNLTATAAKNPDLFRGFMAGAEEAYGANTELAEAAAIAYDTMQSKQDMALNAVENAGANVGVNVGEALQPVIEKIGELAKAFGELDEGTQDNWVKVAGALLLLGPSALWIGTVAKGVGTLVTALAGMTMATMGTAITTFGAIAGAGAALTALAEIVKNYKNPVTFDTQDLAPIQAQLDGIVATTEEISPALQKAIDKKAKYDAFMAAVNSPEYASGDWKEKAKTVAPFAEGGYEQKFLEALNGGSLGSLVKTMQADMELQLGEAMTEAGLQIPAGLNLGIETGRSGTLDAVGALATDVDDTFTGALGIESPSTLFIQHGLDTVLGLQEGILEGIPVAASAMTMLGEALTAIAAAQGARAGTAYGTAFSMSASAQLSFAMAQIKRELDQLNIRINRGYGSI